MIDLNLNSANDREMKTSLKDELNGLLQGSDARLRKHWAQRICQEKILLIDLLPLLHGHLKTAQRFTWLIGDLLDEDPGVVMPVLPMLFDLRDQMPFPGMQRSVAKCLWFLNVPTEVEAEAIPQLFDWLANDQSEVGVKHYASKALFDLAVSGRIKPEKLIAILRKQTHHPNKAHAGRMEKLLNKLDRSLSRRVVD